MKSAAKFRGWVVPLLAISVFIVATVTASASHPSNPGVYTLDADFSEGTLNNVIQTPADQLQLDQTTSPFGFIWVSNSQRGTIAKIDTATGVVLGEYWSSPAGRGRNPSRTSVDAGGNVWAGNRAESTGGQGSVVQIGLEENGQCIDRDSSGTIDTSTGLGDIKAWSNGGGVDDNGGVTTAADECIIGYVRVSGDNIRHVSVDGFNNVWAAGNFGSDNSFDLIDNATKTVLVSTGNLACGGYGGLVDSNGVLWSANRGPGGTNVLLRYDTNNTITLADDSHSCLATGNSYGLAVDSSGNIWHSQWTNNNITKYTSAGAFVATYPTGGLASRGVAITSDNNVWIANSNSNTVTRLSPAGALLATIAVGALPTGVSVDSLGKVWVTNRNSHNAMRIDPSTDLVDLTVALGAGAFPYNYSDMTGSTVTAPPAAGTWVIEHDSGIVGAIWGDVSWTALTDGNSSLAVSAESSVDNSTWSSSESATNGGDLSVPDGQFLRVTVVFTRGDTDTDADGFNESPILYDLTITGSSPNEPPDCSNASPSVDEIWPPNHKMVDIDIIGVTDPDGDAISINIDSIFQDEPVNTVGDGDTEPDGAGVGTSTAQVRAERSGSKKVPGDGRFYHISYTASDGNGADCSGTVEVVVPHDQGKKGSTPVDQGPLHDSTVVI